MHMDTLPQPTNQHIFDLLQQFIEQANKNFKSIDGRLDGIDERFNSIEEQFKEVDRHFYRAEHRLSIIEITLKEVKNEQKAQRNDIKEILDRLVAFEIKVDRIIYWAKSVDIKLGTKLILK